MTVEDLKEKGLIILECLSGSKAYGLDTPESDTDIKGVFILPKHMYYGLNYIPQVSNSTNDIVYYELGRFIELLSVNNPNILELLYTPESAVLYKHPVLDQLKPEWVLSKRCEKTFGNFALSQIKKARGLNKKIVNPVDKKRKSLIDFCYVTYQQGTIGLSKFLETKSWKAEHCGLVKLPNMNQVYGLYYNPQLENNGILKSEWSNEVCLSQVPKEEDPHAFLYVNQEGYSKYCKSYREYWDWVEKRNEARYQSTLNHGKEYDAKNMMHTIRLLKMAIEIAQQNKVIVKREDREFLLNIKHGGLEFNELLSLVEQLKSEMKQAYIHSTLPIEPQVERLNTLIFELREELYLVNKYQ